jgi:hypothetical protein
MNAYMVPERVPISSRFEMCATKAGLMAVYVPELNPNKAAKAMADSWLCPGSHNASIKIVERVAAAIDTLKLPTLSAIYPGRIRPIPLLLSASCCQRFEAQTSVDKTHFDALKIETRYPAILFDRPTCSP